MTKLYENDAYIKEFETKVKNVDLKEKQIELVETAFYGKGGGQPGDKGFLQVGNEKIIVLDTIKKGDVVLHEIDDINKIEKNTIIKGNIDWNIRYKHMRMHSALHLMCSIIPLGVTGGQIRHDKSRLDFNDPEKKINKELVEEKLNEIIKEDHKISCELIDSKILEEKPEIVRTMSVKPPLIHGKIRLIRIGNIDLQPCGGTHVKSTIEIGKITIGKVENKGKMNRRVNILLND